MIFVTEILERYGNYLIAALLPLFLNEQRHMAAGSVLRLVGYYLALGYAGGVVGGWLADRWLGYRGATRVGAALLLLGAALLTSAARGTLYPALGLLILGSSCFKPALSAWLGSLYADSDPGRSTGFGWLYFAANIGALLAPFVGGLLRTYYSWPVAFATTVGAFALCLVVVVVTQSAVPSSPAKESAPLAEEGKLPSSAPPPASDAAHWRTLLALLLVVLLFSVAYGQSGGALLFFTRDHVDRRALGYVMPPDFFASVPSALVLILTALQQILWKTLRRRRRPPAATKMLLVGMISSGIAFAVLSAVAALHAGTGPAQLISALWIAGALTLLTLGEILVIPVAMALVSQSARRGQGALAQGLLSAAMAVGLALAGEAGRFFTEWGATRFFAAAAVVPLVGALVLAAEARRWPTATPAAAKPS